MPEILILCEYPTLNGGERSMLATLDGVRAGGFAPAVIAPPDGPLAKELEARGVELIPFQCRAADAASKGTVPFSPTTASSRCPRKSGQSPQNRLREELAEILRRRRPALLHANSLAMGRLSGPVAADGGLPSIAHLRDIIRLSPQAVADLNRHRRLLAVSAATREFHVARGLDAEKTRVLYNGVDLDEFRPRTPTGYLHRELGLPSEAQLIGTIGQIGLRKGQDVLLEAAAVVFDRSSTAHLAIVGERNSDKGESREYENELHRVAGSRLAGRVHFFGRRNDIPQLLNELTVLAHAARQEPLGRVLLEAAASGVAIVATDVGGTREILPQKTAARLSRPDDAAGLAAAVLELLGNRQVREHLALTARERAEERFDIRKTVSELLHHYKML
jgi:glycosyltransferase involved in cell wall biosynthesis